MVKAYYYLENNDPMTELHDSGEYIPLEDLEKIGVFYKSIDSQLKVDELAIKRNYKNRDYITLDLNTFPGGEIELNKKLDIFFTEHLHEDEEIRYIIDGTGFFDVRNKNDKWIRLLVEKNDMLILPAGIYHRFTLTNSKFIKALRLFKDEPKWIALNRNEDQTDSNKYRKQYIDSITTN